jgi:RNA polymerase sigma-70 factor, ECF subfamily
MSVEAERELLERQIQERMGLGDHVGATNVAIRGYGPELFRFLVALHRDEQAAGDVFSEVTERIWKGLPSFVWKSSFRTWAYAIARNASLNHRRDSQRRAGRQSPLPEGSDLAVLAQSVRSETLAYLKTENRSRVAKLRESLSHDDQELLMLRIDRRLGWNELAEIMCESEAPPSVAELKREAARLRKRFQLLKERLRELGRREGLVGGDT